MTVLQCGRASPARVAVVMSLDRSAALCYNHSGLFVGWGQIVYVNPLMALPPTCDLSHMS